MKNAALILSLLIILRADNSELSTPAHYGPVSAVRIQSEFGEQSIISTDPALGSAHRIFPQNDTHSQETDLFQRSIKYIKDSPDIFRTPAANHGLIFDTVRINSCGLEQILTRT